MKKRILVITSTFPSSFDDPIPTFVRDQIISLKQGYADLEFFVLAPHDAYSSTWEKKEKLENEAFYIERRFHYFWPYRYEKLTGRGIIPALVKDKRYYFLVPFFAVFEFFALLKYAIKLKPDILYAHWFMPQGINAGLVSYLTGIPFVYTSHSSDVAILRKVPLIGPMIVRSISNRAKAITVVSKRSLEKLRSFFGQEQWNRTKNKVAIIPMGVNIEIDTEITSIENKPNNILFLGRLVEKKGVQYLLPAYAKILKQHSDLKLTIAGDGDWLPNLQEQAVNLGISQNHIKFTGFISGDQKDTIIRNADIFVVPSIITEQGDMEGLPVSLLEGLAAGKICIATYESGADDILVDGVDGFLVPEKDSDALERALNRAITLSVGDRIIMRSEASKTVREFSWKNISDLYAQKFFK